MPQYLTPGVYVEEVPSSSKPIAGVGTSTAGFVGIVDAKVLMPLQPGRTGVQKDGKTAEPKDYYKVADAGTPVFIDSWETFRINFGDIQPGNQILAHAVYGFFNNGGGSLYVTRVVSAADDKAFTDAIATFTAIDEIAIVAVPGNISDVVQVALVNHCENKYTQDRFAILDGRPEGELSRSGIAGPVASSYGAVYHPWIDVGAKDASGAILPIPPSGHIAGVYARVDTERGVYKAPANEVIRGALGVTDLVSREAQSLLNPVGVNVIRPISGAVTIWGARTLAGANQPEWNYISSRRLFNFLRESIDQGTQWVTFEPNAPELWSKVRRNVTAFLTTVWASGALLGTTPEEAFYVRCDASTNPEAVRDLGQLVTEIGVALVKPAEFVVFRVSQWSGAEQ